MADRIDMLLYDGLEHTGRLEYSTVSAAGPWTALNLSTPTPAMQALEEWAAAIGAATSLGVSFSFDETTQELQLAADGPLWLKLSETLKLLLGLTDAIIALDEGAPYTSDEIVLAVASLPLGRSHPVDVERADLELLHAGRATTYHHGRAVEVTIDISIPTSVWDGGMNLSPLVSGHTAFRVTSDTTNDFQEAVLDGVLIVYPIGTPRLSRTSPDDYLNIELLCSMEDPP